MEEPASPMARLWVQRKKEDVDLVIHLILALGPRGQPNGTPSGTPGGTSNGTPKGTPNGSPSGTPNAPPGGSPLVMPDGMPVGVPGEDSGLGRDRVGSGGGSFDVEEFKQLLVETFVGLPRFSSLLVKRRRWWGLGEEYAWVPTEVNIGQHVKEVDITLNQECEHWEGQGSDGEREGGQFEGVREGGQFEGVREAAHRIGTGGGREGGGGTIEAHPARPLKDNGGIGGHPAGPPKDDCGIGDAQRDCVMRYVEEQTMLPMPRDRPLWEVQVITHPPLPSPHPSTSVDKDPTPSTYTQSILWRLHHALGDGVALSSIITQTTRTPEGVPPSPWSLPLSDSLRKRRTTLQGLLWRAKQHTAYFFNSFLAVFNLLYLLFSAPDPAGGAKSPSTDIRSVKRQVARFSVPLTETKSLAKSCGATVNDLLLALMSAAVHWSREGTATFGAPGSRRGGYSEESSSAPVCGRSGHCEESSGVPRVFGGSWFSSSWMPRALFMSNLRPPPPEICRKILFGQPVVSGQPRGKTLGGPGVMLGTRVGFVAARLPYVDPPLTLSRDTSPATASGQKTHFFSPDTHFLSPDALHTKEGRLLTPPDSTTTTSSKRGITLSSTTTTSQSGVPLSSTTTTSQRGVPLPCTTATSLSVVPLSSTTTTSQNGIPLSSAATASQSGVPLSSTATASQSGVPLSESTVPEGELLPSGGLNGSGSMSGNFNGQGSMSSALRQLVRQTEKLKLSFEAWAVYLTLMVTCSLMGPQAMLDLVLHVLGKVTTGLSNVPGPKERLSIAGSPILGADQFLAGSPVGVTVHAASYASRLHVTVTSHPGVVHADAFGSLMVIAWQQLHAEISSSKGSSFKEFYHSEDVSSSREPFDCKDAFSSKED